MVKRKSHARIDPDQCVRLSPARGFKWRDVASDMIDSAKELLQSCNSARQLGSDFPTVWQQILKRHSLVAGMPIQGMNSEGPTLEVPLLTGQRLIFGAKAISLG